MGLLWRLFAPKGLKKARGAMHPSWVLEDAIVRGARKRKRPRRTGRRESQRVYTAELRDTATGQSWTCSHEHRTEKSANRCADAMEDRINRLGLWERSTGDRP
jgi:hypothetical protein